MQGYKLLYEASSSIGGGNLENLGNNLGIVGGNVPAMEEENSRETKISHGLSTILQSLNPYTNYTVQVLAYTRAGEGISSNPVSCTTEETG